MQIPFITDLRVRVFSGETTSPALTMQFSDLTGSPVGTSVVAAEELAAIGRGLIALAEAATLFAVGADGATRPDPLHVPIMRDVRVAEVG